MAAPGGQVYAGRSAAVIVLALTLLTPGAVSGQSQAPQQPRSAPASRELPLTIGIEKLADIGCNGQLSFFRTKADQEIAHPDDALERRFGRHVVWLWDSGKMIARMQVNRAGQPPELKRLFDARKEDLMKVLGEPDPLSRDDNIIYVVEGVSVTFAFRNGRVDEITWQCAD